ncbi:hypothetical protein V9T40_010844 [Parthenolecanium corni]|uniref:Uncharacterized protein n=1 Tax=Parthenolecanium corni TaxID=536013 RepID=A0AAN9T4C5_9HEMI
MSLHARFTVSTQLKSVRHLFPSVPDPSISDMISAACASSNEERVLTNKSHKILYSYCERNRITFFLSLPYKMQIALLTRTERMFTVQLELPYFLGDTLNITFDDVRRWLNKRLLRNLDTADKPEFTNDKVEVLEEELGLAIALNYEYSMLLGYVLQLPPAAIRLWFEREKAKSSGAKNLNCIEKLKFAVPKPVPAPSAQKSGKNLESASLPETGAGASDENELLSDPQLVSLTSFEEFQFSQEVAAVIGKRKSNFFYNLPLATQVTLLKCVHTLPTTYQPVIDKVATRLGVSVFQTMAWLSVVRCKYVEINNSKLVPPMRNGLLNGEFAANQSLSEERALILSYILEIPFNSLCDWFHNRKVLDLLSTVAAEENSNSGNSEFDYLKNLIRISRFKRFTLLSDKEAKDLADKKESGPSEGRSWSDSTQQFVRLLKMDDILKKLAHTHPREQVNILDERYRLNKGIFGPQDIDTLASNLKMTEQDIIDWLNWRLLYELLKVYGEKLSIWLKEDCYEKIHTDHTVGNAVDGPGAQV